MTAPEQHLHGRILVVDDDEAHVRTLEAVLHEAGYDDVPSTTDARAVEGMVSEVVPDLILLDLRMPDLDGHALLERLAPLREREGYLPVIVLTADADPAARHRALELGATDYVTKPIDPDEVVLRCRNLLHTRQLYRRVAERHETLAGELVAQAGELRNSRLAHELVLGALNHLEHEASLEESAAALVREFSEAAEFDTVAVITFDAELRTSVVAAAGTPSVVPPIGQPLFAASGPSQRELGRPWGESLESAGDDPYTVLLRQEGLRSVWYVPIVQGRRVAGVLAAASLEEPTDDLLASRLPIAQDFAAITGAVLQGRLAQRYQEEGLRSQIAQVVREKAFSPVFQPVVEIGEREVIGFEALTRFADGEPPERRFAEAHRVGIGLHLEEETLRSALTAARTLPDAAWISVNVSPELLLAGDRLARILDGMGRPVVIEITEHVAIQDYAALRDALHSLGENVRIAVDDAGAGFASFQHVLEIEPDFVKLDVKLVHGIATDPSRQALVVGMRYFAEQTGCALIAEGVETEDERRMLCSLGLRLGQGILFGRPQPASAGAVDVSEGKVPAGRGRRSHGRSPETGSRVRVDHDRPSPDSV